VHGFAERDRLWVVKVGLVDARRLPPVSQEDLRRRVVAAVESGRLQVEVAAVFGVSSRCVSEFRAKGNRGWCG
jgi:hypothetical protein